MKNNVAKINLEVSSCNQCPFGRDAGKGSTRCVHDLPHGIDVGEGEYVPDFCPFVLQRLQKILDFVEGSSNAVIPKVYVYKVERMQKVNAGNSEMPKRSVDHSFQHIRRVQDYGVDFLHACVDAGICSSDEVEKAVLLFKLAAYMHDIGLADSLKNHAIHSSELAKNFLSRQDIDENDMMTIVHAIANHSDGRETRNIVDAALLIADKLDMTGNRIIAVVDDVTDLCTKVTEVRYSFYHKKGKVVGAKLEYKTEGLNGEDIIKVYPKSVLIPKMITQEFLKLPEFKFIVDGATINVDALKY